MSGSLYIPVMHMIAVAPLIMYIGYNIYNKTQMNTDFGLFLIMLAVLIFVYHAYKYYKYSQN
jgi:hypothetical protein